MNINPCLKKKKKSVKKLIAFQYPLHLFRFNVIGMSVKLGDQKHQSSPWINHWWFIECGCAHHFLV